MTNKKQIGTNTEAYNKLIKYCEGKNYLSLEQIYGFLSDQGYSYSIDTIKKYLHNLKQSVLIFTAGRGFYSKIKNEFQPTPNDLNELIELIKTKYPLITFSIWSTKLLSPFFHHTQNQFYIFLYADKDSLIFLRDFLIENNFKAYLNPSINDKNIVLQNNTVILRDYITRSKEENNISSIEKILVDFLIESEKLNLIDFAEYEKLFEAVITGYRLNISYLIDYSGRRKVNDTIQKLVIKYTNATLGK